MSACSKIRQIVRLRQMLRQWRRKSSLRTPPDVPAGHVAVSVGANCRRFVVRTTYLNHPIFRKLLVQAEEEYGFTNTGPLAIPCEESVFEEALKFLARIEGGPARPEDFQTSWCCRGGAGVESRPLLYCVLS